MKQLLLLPIFTFVIGIINAQNNSSQSQSTLSSIVTTQANKMASVYKQGDYKAYVKYMHPVIVQAMGGETKMTELLTAQGTQIKAKGIVINSIVFDQPSEIVKSKNDLQCTISQQSELSSAKGKVITFTTLVAISIDNGKNWKFIDASKMDITAVRKLYPNLSSKIILPPKRKPLVSMR